MTPEPAIWAGSGPASGRAGRAFPRTHHPPELPGVSPRDLPAWQSISQVLLTQNGERRKQLTARYGFPAEFNKHHWASLIQALPDPLVRHLKHCRQLEPVGARPEEAQSLQDLVILLGEAPSTYEKLGAQQQALDFIALEQATLRLLTLEDPGELLLRLDLRLRHLLVDEFQDTSQNQMELLCRLMAGWQAGEGRTLMVVGTPSNPFTAGARPSRGFRRILPGPALSRGALPPGIPAAYHQFPGHPDLDRLGQRGLRRCPGRSAGLSFHPADPRPGAAAGPVPRAGAPGRQRKPERPGGRGPLAGPAGGRGPGRIEASETIGILLFTRTHLPIYLQALAAAGLTPRVREGRGSPTAGWYSICIIGPGP